MANAVLIGKAPTRDWLQRSPDANQIWVPGQVWTWEKACYTVPREVSEERVQSTGHRYRNKFGKLLEMQGFTVLEMQGPTLDESLVALGTTEPDRRRYIIWAKVTRRPQEFHVDVPDEDVAIYQGAGFTLRE